MFDVYTIAVDNKDIIVRVREGSIDGDALARFLDYLELETIRRRSQLSDDDAEAMTEEIDRSVWAQSKQKYLEG